MRCPKCGYISFDHNQICPKCNKDISDEQAKLNLPTYKNNPPSLLGMLVGAGDESNVGFTLDSDAALRNSGMGLDFEEASSMMDSNGLGFGDDDQDLEISLNDDTGEFELPELDMDDQSGNMSDIDLGDEDEELSLDMDEVSFEDSEDTADDLNLDEISMEEGDVSDSLDGVSPSESLVLGDTSDLSTEETDETMEFGSLSRNDIEGHSTVELNVSDLKINETGELEVNSIPDEIYSPASLPEEEEIKIDEITIESEEDEPEEISARQKDARNRTGSLGLSDLSLGASGKHSLDEMGGMDTAELSAPKDEEGFDLGDLALNDNSTGELRAADFEINKSASINTENPLELEDDISINLENLDLDLELDDTDGEK